MDRRYGHPPPGTPCVYSNLRPITVGTHRWVMMSAGQAMPANAVEGGRDTDGATIYVGRAYHDGDTIPANVIPSKKEANIVFAGQEYAKHNFEILVHDYEWVPSKDGKVPSNAVVAGFCASGAPAYVGRVYHCGSQTVGKILDSSRLNFRRRENATEEPCGHCLYIPFDGKELCFKEYEVLVSAEYHL